MMPAARRTDLIDSLPPVRGRLRAGVPLARYTWFRVGGPAEVLFEPADGEDLESFLEACPEDVAVTVLGVGSNVLVRDGGIGGVVVRLGRPFARIRAEDERLFAGAGASCPNVAKAARDAGIAGLEFLSGVPGSLGGAIRMNAGAYGSELAAVLTSARVVGRSGGFQEVAAAELGFAYRHSAAPDDWIFVAADLRGQAGDPAAIGKRMAAVAVAREESQPIRTRTGGSTFTNPPGARAWELIDRAGCRGLRRGGAQVSEKHCNFLVNTGDASAADLEGLGEEVRRRVFAATGVTLAWEIRRVGELAEPAPREVTS